jgi:streptogramin lyase
MAIATPAMAGADPVGTVTEFSAGISPASEPYDIVTGPDGNLWFTELGGNRIARMTPTGTVSEFPIASGFGVRGIVPATDGNLWFVTDDGTVSRITPAGVQTGFSAGDTTFGAADPYMLAQGADGNLWFTNWDYSRVSRITPSGVVTSFSAGITGRPYDIVAGPDGNLWFTEPHANASRIGRITPAGVVTEFSLVGGSRPYGITVGPDGNLWFTQRGDGNDGIGRITPTGTVTIFSAGITPGSTPLAITAGADGNLWFTEFNGDRIGRITPTGTVTEFSAGITPGSAPYGIAAGPDGQVWFTERAGNRIGRITATVPAPAPAPAPAPVAAGEPCASVASVLAVAPASGPSGSAVTITGSGFGCATGVLFGDTPALGYTVDGDRQITARAPSSAVGDVDVRVLSSAGASAIVPGDRFTFTGALTALALPVSDQPLAPIGDQRTPICGRVPTLTRYTLAQARRVLARDHCDVRLRVRGSAPRRGHRRSTSQAPKPGTALYAGDARPTVRFG